jgi:hypothetical protein
MHDPCQISDGLASGRSCISYDEVREKLRLGGPVYRGIQTVPLDKIVGSVNRYRDFDRFFAPTQTHTQARWRRIVLAWYREINLPPVLLYKVGEVYFVVDGNHRISVARSQGQLYIDADVREAASRVPLTESVGPEDLIRLGERVDFLERTQFDRIRPGVDIETTLLGGYDRLIEHIAVHRYFMGLKEGREISDSEAVEHWYDTLYEPVVKVIEAADVLEALDGRTKTDLYLWVMDHLHYIREQPGHANIPPDSAAEDFVRRIKRKLG